MKNSKKYLNLIFFICFSFIHVYSVEEDLDSISPTQALYYLGRTKCAAWFGDFNKALETLKKAGTLNLSNMSIKTDDLELILIILSHKELADYKVKELDLSYNELTELPQNFLQLTELETLNLFNNHLHTQPDFHTFTKLQTVTLPKRI